MKLLVFTYAPAGLGHLRVTDALVDSRPRNHPYVMLGSYDRFITSFHRFFSTNLIAKWVFTVSQYGLFADFATAVYRGILILTSGQIYKQLKNIISENKNLDEMWVVATHFGMAHQIGAVKEKLEKDTGKKIRLIVQVTDDTSQHIWCIRGADLTFVPSHHTKKLLQRYANRLRMNLDFEVIPYPLCPILTKKVEGNDLRKEIYSQTEKHINVSVPISGAAVGLSYISKLISSIVKRSKRFKFWVVVKKSVYTDVFLSTLSKLPEVELVTGRNDNEMISIYELLYQNNLMSIEITKPSEQAFKAILSPSYVGGSLMLFTSPVGRQEYENIDFLVRNDLMSRSNYDGNEESEKKINNYPRAIRLPKDPDIAADFILWGLETGLFPAFSSKNYKYSDKALESGEVGPDGAYCFWKIVEKHFD